MAKNIKTELGVLKIFVSKKGKKSVEIHKVNGKMYRFPFGIKNVDQYDNLDVELTSLAGNPIKLVAKDSGKIIYTKEEVTKGNTNKIEKFNWSKTMIPNFTKSVLTELVVPDNFNLRFNKAARFERETGGKLKPTLLKLDSKKKIVYKVESGFKNINFKAIQSRQQLAIQNSGFQTLSSPIIVSNNWRWVTGMGNASVYENGISLHHVYGIPYLQGSGVKGMLRTWIINQCWGYEKKGEETALKNKVFQAIFGHPENENSEGKKGKVHFFDCFPTESVTVAPDVMNNHYQSYYEGKTPPADWINPNPIFFLSVKGGKYAFQIGIKCPNNSKLETFEQDIDVFLENFPNVNKQDSLLQLAKTCLVDALEHHGVGAKTAVGYGRMIQ